MMLALMTYEAFDNRKPMMLDLKASSSLLDSIDKNNDLNEVASWLETQEIGAHYPAASAQSMSSAVHPAHQTLLPRALSMFPKGRPPVQAELSNSGTEKEGLGATEAPRPNSTGTRLQLLKRRQQVTTWQGTCTWNHNEGMAQETALVPLRRISDGPRALLC